jgi:hypothetical protein
MRSQAMTEQLAKNKAGMNFRESVSVSCHPYQRKTSWVS